MLLELAKAEWQNFSPNLRRCYLRVNTLAVCTSIQARIGVKNRNMSDFAAKHQKIGSRFFYVTLIVISIAILIVSLMVLLIVSLILISIVLLIAIKIVILNFILTVTLIIVFVIVIVMFILFYFCCDLDLDIH